MSIDPTLFANGLPAGTAADTPVTATVQATAPTARQAAAAVQDVAGGIAQDLNQDAARDFGPYRKAAFVATGVVGAYLLGLFGYLLGDWIGTGNQRAAGALLGLNSYATPLLAAIVAYGAGLFTKVPGSRAK